MGKTMFAHKNLRLQFSRVHTIILFVNLIFVGLLGACQPAKENEVDSTIASSNSAEYQQQSLGVTEAISEAAEGNDLVIISFAVSETSRSLYERIANAFHDQYPGIMIQLVSIPNDLSQNSVDNLRTVASAADTTLLFGSRDKFIDTTGLFLDITPAMEADAEFDSDDFWNNSLNACVDMQGHTMGLPLTLSFMGVFYDPVAFTNAGIPLPNSGWTWDEFQQIVKTLATQPNQSTELVADSSAFESSFLAPIIDAHLVESGGQINADDLSQLIQWYIELARTHLIYPIQNPDNILAAPSQPALWIAPLSASLPSGEDEMAINHYDIAPFPTSSDNAGSTVLWPTCAVVSSGTKHPQEAWTWINYLSHQWAYPDLPQSFLSSEIPARKSVVEGIDYWNRVPGNDKEAIQAGLEHGWYGTRYPQTFQAVKSALLKALTGEDLALALSEANIAPTPTADITPIVVATPSNFQSVQPGSQVIHYLYPDDMPNADQIYAGYANEFQSLHPDITVLLSTDFSWPGGDPLPYLTRDYDCFYSDVDPNSQLDLLYSLSPLIAQEDSSFINDFYPGRLDAFSSSGQVFGLPASNMLYLMYYNADILAEKSIQPPVSTWTFDDFMRLATAATSSGSSGQMVYGAGGVENILFASRGLRWTELETDPPQLNFNQTSTMDTISWFTQLTHSGVIFPSTGDNFGALNQTINSGEVAFWSGLNRADDSNSYSFTLGIAPVPILQNAMEGMGWLLETGQFISKQSSDPDACWSWIKFVSEKADAFPNIPARRSVILSPDYATIVGSEDASTFDIAQGNALQALSDIKLNPIQQWAWQALTAISQGSDTRISLNEAQQKADTYISCLGQANLLQTKILTATSGNKDQRDQVTACAVQADPGYSNPSSAP
jgi:ABC-type glycerol-3-phosphate transport system substrate-binding protein